MIRFLGEPSAVPNDASAGQNGIGRKCLSVLAVIATSGTRGIRREKLAALVWPDRDDAQARSVLRQALTALRKALDIGGGMEIETPGDMIRLAAPEDAIDVRAFEAACQAIANGDRSMDTATKAAALYGGEFMSGMSFNDELLSYMLSVRQKHHDQALTAVEEMSLHPELAAPTEKLATVLTGIDPTAEEAHRALIRVALSRGKRNRALQLFKSLQTILKEELGTEPEPETCALFPAEEPHEGLANESTLAQHGPQIAVTHPAEKAPPLAVARYAAHAPGRRPSIAVLPFVELGEQAHDFLPDAIVNEITLALSRMQEFFVIARQSSFAYKDRCMDMREVGAALGARYILDGVLQRAGPLVRLNVQLVDTTNGTVVMARSFESEKSDILRLQVKIAQQVAGVILPSVRRQEIATMQQLPLYELGAYGLVLSAYPKFWAQERDKNLEAIKLYSMALEREPDYALAHSLKAWCHAQNTCYLWTDNPALERQTAIEHARAAASFCENDATALTAIGATYSMVTNDRDLAQHYIDRSLEIDPCNAWAWMRNGWLKVLSNEPRIALDSFQHSEDLSPLDPFLFNVFFGQAMAWSLLGEIDRAIELVYRGLKHGPAVNWAYRMLASFYAQANDIDGMTRSLSSFRKSYPGVTITQLAESLPPIMVENNPTYMDLLRRAGIPETALGA